MKILNSSIDGGGGGRLLLLALATAGAVIAGLVLPSSVDAQIYEPSNGTGRFSFAVGGDHACAIDGGGSLSCWGQGDRGQISAPSGTFIEVIAGGDYTCAHKAGGPITCFGSVTGSWDSWDDLFAVHARPWFAGRDHSCTRSSSSGRIGCSGRNVYGQAESGHYGSDLRVGRDHNCSISNDGRVNCWGRDTHGQSTVPDGRYREIAAGRAHTCAITDTERLRCWGEAVATSPGDASSSGSPWSYIWSNSNARFTCAANEDRKLYCWGDNSNGQLNVPADFSLDGSGPTEEPDPPATESSTEPQAASSTGTTTSTSTSSSSATSRILRGRVIAHIHDRTGDDGEDNYSIEFAFLPEWALPAGKPVADVVEENPQLMPNSRWISKTRVDGLVRTNNQNWLLSDPAIAIPFAPPDTSTGDVMSGEESDATSVAGRVIARYRLGTGGSVRIEFGFVPESALSTGTGGAQDQAAISRYRESRDLPDSRFLNQSDLANRRGVWLRSSVIEVGSGITCPMRVTAIPNQIEAPRGLELDPRIQIGIAECPLSTELSPITADGLPKGLKIETRFAGADRTALVVAGTVADGVASGTSTVTLQVRGQDGDPVTVRTEIRVVPGPRDPVIDTPWDGYDPDSTTVGGRVRLLPPVVIEGPSRVVWRYDSTDKDICTVVPESGSLTAVSEGQCEIIATLTATEPKRWKEGKVSTVVRISEVSGCITWDGYEPNSMTVSGRSPRLLRPETRDCDTDRLLFPDYTYDVANSSTGICEVSSSGSITALQEGTCTVVVNSSASGNYGPATLQRSVTVSRKSPPMPCRLRYAGNVEVDDRANADFNCPDGGPPEFRTETSTICSVHRDNGNATGIAEGTCEIVVDVPETSTHAATTVRASLTVTLRPPVINSISCAPTPADMGDRITCTPRLSGGEPDTFSWRGGDSGDPSGRTYTTSFNTSGNKSISLTVSNSAGSDSDSTRFTIGREPVVQISCTPSRAEVDDRIECTPSLSGGVPDSYSWRGGDSGDPSGRTYITSFNTSGNKTISLTVSNSAGSDRDSTSLTILPSVEPPAIDGITCTPSLPQEDDSVSCTVRLSGGVPDRYSWSSGDSSGDDSRYTTSFARYGNKTISLTVRNSAGSDTASTSLRVIAPPVCDDNPHAVNINEDDEEPFPSEGYCFDPEGADLTIRTSSGDSGIAHAEEDRRQGWIFVGNGHGTATITVTATDPDGLSASAWVTVNVRGTVRCGDIPSVFGTVNGSRRQIDLDDYCRHPVARRNVTYSNARSDDTRYARVQLNGSTLTITPGSAVGTANITFTATGSGLNTRTFSDWFEVIVNPTNRGGSGGGGGGGTTAPRVSVSCPSSADLRQTVTCEANVSGGTPDSYSWSGGSSSGGNQNYRVSFNSPGVYRISATVRNSAGSDSDNDTIRVEMPPIPPSGEDLARCGSDRQSVYFFNQARWTKHHLNMGWNEAVSTWARRGKTWSENIIDRLSQSDCNKWPTGADYTYTNNPW